MFLHLKAFTGTPAALSAKIEITGGFPLPAQAAEDVSDHEDSMLAAGCLLAVHDLLFSCSLPCETAGSVTSLYFYFSTLKGLALWICYSDSYY